GADFFFRLPRPPSPPPRKPLRNALSAVWPVPDAVAGRIRAAGIDPGVRGETLGVEEFSRLCDAFLSL
ncbi:MAG: 16S rRNA (adenine(1518)-N(6)/adenine(1519)-N(6))-dimethyltransferase, partial [Oscillospiraceae bacterium]|nr:16S rRNA (adenine(1518)-N(6)/adenine(1519)-N(6))-dimethyltransferase [Oscillospiraceae bacterium]